jgi:N-acetyl sugar amidotransferase
VAREAAFRDLLDSHRRTDGGYEVVVPGSGGKDSRYTSHVLQHRYGMRVLTCTWPPAIPTRIGRRNFDSWVAGVDNVTFTPNGRVHRTLTRLAFENLGHPFQSFIYGQHAIGARVALQHGVRLVLYGDWYMEKGVGTDLNLSGAEVDPRMYSTPTQGVADLYFGGVYIGELGQHGISPGDLVPYLPLDADAVADLQVLYLPYFLDYDPNRSYRYAAERTGFEINPHRSEGTYSRHQSLDDGVDGQHHFLWCIKTGRGRCTEDASLDVRNGHMTRERAAELVRQYDGEFPAKYFADFLAYIGISIERYWEIVDGFRPDHIWKRSGTEWVLRQQVA